MELKTPEVIKKDESKYKPDAWKSYSVRELGDIVAFFLKRATHRSDREKAKEDVRNAIAYMGMIEAHIVATAEVI